MNKPDILAVKRRIKIEDNALREHYREGMEKKRVPSDYLLMFTEGGESSAVGYAIAEAQRDDTFWETLKMLIEVLKNYGISITNEGILAPYSDEWDYLYDTPRRVLLKGNDKAESAKSLWEAIKGAH